MANKIRLVQGIKRLEEKVKRPAALKIGASALQKVLISPAMKVIRAAKYKLSQLFGADFLAHVIEGEYILKGDVERHDFGTDDNGLKVDFPVSVKNMVQGLNQSDLIEVMSVGSELHGQKFAALGAAEISTPAVAAEAVLSLTADITLTSTAAGADRNTETFETVVNAAADNDDDEILVVFTGTAAAIVCTTTPNDGTNNSATPVNLSTAELVQLINTGAVTGKNVVVTDVGNLRALQTAAGGGATALAAGGEGDEVEGTFADGEDALYDVVAGKFEIISGTEVRLPDIADFDPETDVVFKVKYSAGSRK